MDTKIKTSARVAKRISNRHDRTKRIFQLRIIFFIALFILVAMGQKGFAQGVGISEVKITPHASSILELQSTERGFLIPRMTSLQRTSIVAPAQGLLVYDNETSTFWYYDSGWEELTTQTEFNNIQAELDNTQLGAGLDTNGDYIQNALTNYIFIATDLAEADSLLDAQLKTIADSTHDINELPEGFIYVGSNTNVLEELDASSDGFMLIGDGNTVKSVDISGDIDIDNTGEAQIQPDAVTASEIATGAVTTDEIFNGTILTEDIADNAITNVKMADDAIGNAELQDNAVTTNEIALNTIIADDIADDAVTTDEILNGAANTVLKTNAAGDGVEWGSLTVDNITGQDITSTDITVTGGVGSALNAVTLALADNSVGNAEMQDNAIGSTEVIDNSLTSDDIAADAVTASEIATGAVTTDEIFNGTILTEDIADNAITNVKMADDAIGNAELQDNAVTTNEIALNTIIADDIADDAVTTDEILNGAANTVLKTNAAGDGVEWGSLTVDNITGQDITSTDITVTGGVGSALNAVTLALADNSVGNAEMQDNAIGSTEVIDNSLTSDDIAADAVTASEIATGAVDTDELAADAVTTAKILNANVTNAKLANSDVSFGGVTLALGASDATPAFDLTDATNYPASSLTGTTLNATVVNSSLTSVGTLTDLTVTNTITGSVSGTATNLSGTPALPDGTTATTQGAGDNSTKLATTAYVDAKVTDAITDGTTNLAPSQNAVFDALALKAPLASPTFTGTVTIPSSFRIDATTVTTTGTQLNYLSNATGTTGTTNTNLVFSESPVLVTPDLGTPSALVGTNITGTASSLTAGTATNIEGGAAGSLIYQTAAGTTTTLPIGGVGLGLRVNAAGDAPEWFAFPGTGDMILNAVQTVTGAKTHTAGFTANGEAVNLNVNSNFSTNINTGTSTGTVTIGNTNGTSAVNINAGSGDVNVNGDLLVSSVNGRIWGINGLASGHTVYFQYGGDASNRIENTWGSQAVFRAYHGTQFYNNNGEIARFGISSGSANSYFQGKLGIGQTSPSAFLHLKAGTAAAGTAPIKLASGTNLTTPEDGALEYDGSNFSATTGSTRYTLAKTLTITQALNFSDVGNWGTESRTITLTGAALGDVVVLGVPSSATNAYSIYTAFVSASNTITVRYVNNEGNNLLDFDPPSATFRVSVLKY